MSSFLARIHRLPVALIASLAWMGVIFAMSARSTVPTPPGLSASLTSIAGHFTVYLVLAMFFYWTLTFVLAPGRGRYLSAWILAIIYGISDEWHQSFVPGRTPDVLDVLTDAVGAAVGLVVAWWIANRLLPSIHSAS